jgi:hypothetical protein
MADTASLASEAVRAFLVEAFGDEILDIGE